MYVSYVCICVCALSVCSFDRLWRRSCTVLARLQGLIASFYRDRARSYVHVFAYCPSHSLSCQDSLLCSCVHRPQGPGEPLHHRAASRGPHSITIITLCLSSCLSFSGEYPHAHSMWRCVLPWKCVCVCPCHYQDQCKCLCVTFRIWRYSCTTLPQGEGLKAWPWNLSSANRRACVLDLNPTLPHAAVRWVGVLVYLMSVHVRDSAEVWNPTAPHTAVRWIGLVC